MSVDSIIAIETGIAALAAVVAALFAAKAAIAAAEQVRLSRPRPIVVASFESYWGSGGRIPNDISVKLENIGDSPAFDIDVGPMTTPGVVPSLGGPSNLKTDRIRYIPAHETRFGNHNLEGLAPGPLSALKPVGLFLDHAKEYFDQLGRAKATAKPDHRYEIEFTISYSALDGRRFEQRYIFVVHFPMLSAWIEPVGSLLEAKTIKS